MNRLRVVIADDYILIQEMIRSLLEKEHDVVATAEDGVGALHAVAAHLPDVLLLDASLPALKGFAVAERIAVDYPQVKVVFVTAHGEPSYVERAFEIGARGYLLKSSLRLELLPCMRTVEAGNLFRSALLRRKDR